MRLYVVSFVLAASAAIAFAQPAETEAAPLPGQTVAWHSPQGDVLMRAQLFFPDQDPHYTAYFADVRKSVYTPVSAVGRPQIAESTPTFFVQGFGYGTNWELVKLRRHHDQDMVYLPSRNPWGDSFFTDQAFSQRDLRPLAQSTGGNVYTLRPAEALDAGAYLLCGQPAGDEGGWMKYCFDFQITH